MDLENDFFIGWQKDMPLAFRAIIRSATGMIFIMTLTAAGLIPYYHTRYDNGKYEMNKTTSLSGYLHMTPAPMFEYVSGKDSMGLDVYQTVLLVSPGKYGAEKILSKYHELQAMINKPIRIDGHMIHAHEHTVFEITRIAEADTLAFKSAVVMPIIPLGKVQLKGEIADPKCLLGVMNPGEGKVHRDCAIRCLSGGITPVFHVQDGNGDHEYYLIVDKDFKPVLEQLIPYVADQVELCGTLSKWGSWYILNPDPGTIRRLNTYHLPDVTWCK
jgi:hypothetical protein